MKRQEILNRAIDCVCGQRNRDYGTPENNFECIAQFWSVYLKQELDAHDVAMMMLLLKLCRAISGVYHEDNYIDMAGYAACAAEVACDGLCDEE